VQPPAAVPPGAAQVACGLPAAHPSPVRTAVGRACDPRLDCHTAVV